MPPLVVTSAWILPMVTVSCGVPLADADDAARRVAAGGAAATSSPAGR